MCSFRSGFWLRPANPAIQSKQPTDSHRTTHITCGLWSMQQWTSRSSDTSSERTYLPTYLPEYPYRIKLGPGHFREGLETQLRAREPGFSERHVSLYYTAHEANWDDDYADQNDDTVQKILTQQRGSCPPTTSGNPFVHLCRRSIPPSWSTCAGTRPSSRSLTWKLSTTRLKPWLTHPRREPSQEWIHGAQVCQVVRISLACLLAPSSGAISLR